MKMVSYKKLWHLLIDKEMSKADLKRATGISSSTLASLVAEKNVSLDVLLKICAALDCNFSDMMDAVPNEEVTKRKKGADESASDHLRSSYK